jgi:hypothetical protein
MRPADTGGPQIATLSHSLSIVREDDSSWAARGLQDALGSAETIPAAPCDWLEGLPRLMPAVAVWVSPAGTTAPGLSGPGRVRLGRDYQGVVSVIGPCR